MVGVNHSFHEFNNMNDLVVYTALFGAYDHIAPPPKNAICDYICFTDQPSIAPGWTVIKVDSTNESPVLLNRKFKMLAHKYLSKYTGSLYIDSNIKLKKDPIAVIEKYLSYSSLACPKHFERDCIYLEIKECIKLGKITQQEGNELAIKYKAEKYPERFGLTENNILIRSHNDKKLIGLMELWWESFLAGAKRDQLSLMYLCWKHNFRISQMIESSRNNNKYFSYRMHNSEMPIVEKVATYIKIKKEKYLAFKVAYMALRFFKSRADNE